MSQIARPLPRLIDLHGEPEEVARAVLNAVRRPKRTVIMPWQMRFLVWLNSHLPGLVDWVIEKRFTRLERDI